MGGGAFAAAAAPGEPTLTTPRLTPEQYEYLMAIYLRKLRDYFPNTGIACLTEAPEKADYGDMDILIALNQNVNFIEMANALGAAGIICTGGGGTQKCTLGVHIDGSAHTRPAVIYKLVNEKRGKLEPSITMTVDDYAQIDIAVIQADSLDWYTFYSSYGDMAGLLGHIIHNLGFTISDAGLWLRDEILDFSKTVNYANVADREGRIFLSKDQDFVMQFLGLSVRDYYEGFRTLDALYEWLIKCRLLSPHAVKIKRNNAHERNREEKRKVYSKFFNEYLPTHLEFDDELIDTSDSEEHRHCVQKEAVRKLRQHWCIEAVDFFNKRAEYEKMHSTLTFAVENGLAAELVKQLIEKFSETEGKAVREILRAFRRFVGFDSDGKPCILDKPHSDDESQLHNFLADDRRSLRDPSGTAQWVAENWEELKGLERQRVKAG